MFFKKTVQDSVATVRTVNSFLKITPRSLGKTSFRAKAVALVRFEKQTYANLAKVSTPISQYVFTVNGRIGE